MLTLLRYSKLVAAGVLAAVVVALSLLYRNLVFDSLLDSETQSNVALARAFANAVWPEYAQFIAQARQLPRNELASREEIGRLAGELRRLARDLPVVKVKIYDAGGLTVFSSDSAQIGEDKSTNTGFLRARRGDIASSLTFRDRFDAWEGVISNRDILATYVPLPAAEGAPVEAVIEIYSDVTNLLARAEAGERRILIGVLVAMALVWAAVQLLLSHYQRRLAEEERQRTAQEERMRYQAFHDALTGLPNRASFAEHLGEAVRRAKRARWSLALLFVDLDLFKRVNDSLGHQAGDELLRVVAQRIRGAVREADLLFRMGGDEFTVLLENVGGVEEAAAVARRMLDALAEPVPLHAHEVSVSASIGIALYPRDELDAERLVKCADIAMYRAKDLGRNRYAFFTPEMQERVSGQMRMEAALRRAIRNKEFVLHFQPRVSAATGAVVAMEALLRWRQPEGQVLEAARFVPLLEETGLILGVGDWVLAEACRQASGWLAVGRAPVRVSVNIAQGQLRGDGLVKSVRAALRESGLSPHLLELELGENVLVEDAGHAMDVLLRIKGLGAAVTIDGFGTGHSSLSSLKRFPIDRIKIERSFVGDLSADPRDAAIVDAVCSLAGTLGIAVVAEGVETSWQAEYLSARQCSEMQGFLFSLPLPPQEVAAALNRVYPVPRAMAANAEIHSGESFRQGTR